MKELTQEQLHEYLKDVKEYKEVIPKLEITKVYPIEEDLIIETNTRSLNTDDGSSWAKSPCKKGNYICESSDGRFWVCTKEWLEEHFFFTDDYIKGQDKSLLNENYLNTPEDLEKSLGSNMDQFLLLFRGIGGVNLNFLRFPSFKVIDTKTKHMTENRIDVKLTFPIHFVKETKE